MRYVKSLLAGIAATVLAAMVIVIAGISAVVIVASRQTHISDTSIGWDPVSFACTTPGCIILIVAFLSGFWWEHRKLAERNS